MSPLLRFTAQGWPLASLLIASHPRNGQEKIGPGLQILPCKVGSWAELRQGRTARFTARPESRGPRTGSQEGPKVPPLEWHPRVVAHEDKEKVHKQAQVEAGTSRKRQEKAAEGGMGYRPPNAKA